MEVIRFGCLFFYCIDLWEERELKKNGEPERNWDQGRALWLLGSLAILIALWLLNPGGSAAKIGAGLVASLRLIEILVTGLGTALGQRAQVRARNLVTIAIYGLQLTLIFAILYHSFATTGFAPEGAESGSGLASSDYLYISWSAITSLGGTFRPTTEAARFLEVATTTAGIFLLGVLLAFGINEVQKKNPEDAGGSASPADKPTEQQSERRELARWSGMRGATLAAIWEQTRRMLEPIRELSPDNNAFAVAYETAVKLMGDVHAWIRAQAVPLDEGATAGLDRYEKYKAEMHTLHDAVQKEYLPIRDTLLSRVLELAADADLLELLVALEAAERQWSSCVGIAGPGETEESWGSFPVTAWNAVADFYAAAIGVAEYISRDPERPDPAGLNIALVDVEGRTVARAWTMYEAP